MRRLDARRSIVHARWRGRRVRTRQPGRAEITLPSSAVARADGDAAGAAAMSRSWPVLIAVQVLW
jgi:hypothetical protein